MCSSPAVHLCATRGPRCYLAYILREPRDAYQCVTGSSLTASIYMHQSTLQASSIHLSLTIHLSRSYMHSVMLSMSPSSSCTICLLSNSSDHLLTLTPQTCRHISYSASLSLVRPVSTLNTTISSSHVSRDDSAFFLSLIVYANPA